MTFKEYSVKVVRICYLEGKRFRKEITKEELSELNALNIIIVEYLKELQNKKI